MHSNKLVIEGKDVGVEVGGGPEPIGPGQRGTLGHPCRCGKDAKSGRAS